MACLLPACALPVLKAGTRGGPGWWLLTAPLWQKKKAGTTQASLPQLSPCEPSPVLTPRLSFHASRVRATQPARVRLSPSLSFHLPSSPGILSLLNWSHQSPPGFSACVRQVVTHVLGRLISAPSLAPRTGEPRVLPEQRQGTPSPGKASKSTSLQSEREAFSFLSP